MKTYNVLLFFTSIMLMQFNAPAQWTGEIELYKYIGTGGEGSFQPLAHIRSPNNWYGEIRYNYEDAQTLSLYGGKTFSGSKLVEYSITPMAGYSKGVFTGISLGVNTDAEWKKFYFSAQSQYSISSKTKEDTFLFSWSELGYSITDHFFTGFSLQYTRTICQTDLEPGIVAGICFKNFEMPFYIFKPLRSERYFVLGLSYEFNLGKKK